MLNQDDAVIQELANLRVMGFRLSVDDFGTGYSSLAQLQRLHIDVLKVDPAFTKTVGKDKDAQDLFKAVVSMAHSLRMNVVAEGVETEEQLAALRALACREVQGIFICAPLPGDQIAQVIMNQFIFPDSKNSNPVKNT